MRTHDHDPEVAPSPPDHVARRDDTPVGSRVAQRVLARDRADALTPEAVLHLQRAAGNAGVGALLDEQQAVTKVAGGGGQPLDPDVRQRMESRFGADFSSVRVHTGSEAAQAARAVQAHAYTVGDDVVFGDGAYQPGTPAGERTLAHELAHVLQQRAGPVDGTDTGAGFRLSSPDDRFERAAEETADRVVAGAPAGDVAAAAPVGVQREAAAPEEEEPAAACECHTHPGLGAKGAVCGCHTHAPGVQREAAAPEEEEEPEEAVQGSFVQRQEEPEEEEMPA